MDGAQALATGGNFYELRKWGDAEWQAAREAIQAQNAQRPRGAGLREGARRTNVVSSSIFSAPISCAKKRSSRNSKTWLENSSTPTRPNRASPNGATTGVVERAMWTEAGEAGLLCLPMPEEYGGAGGDYRHEVVFMEQLGA